MNIKWVLVDAVMVFAASLIVLIAVTLLWNLVFHRAATVDWETSFRFAIVLGIILPWMGARRSRER